MRPIRSSRVVALTVSALAAALVAALPARGAVEAGERAAQVIRLSPAQAATLKPKTVRPAAAKDLPLPPAPARVTVPPQAERVISAPRAGLVVRVTAAEGDRVERGAMLAEIESPELVNLQRDFLNARSAAELARVGAERDRALFNDGVIAERRLLQTEQTYREARTTLAAARQLLAGAGMTEADLNRLAETQKIATSLAARAPMTGVVLKRLASAGERVGEQQPLYRIADPTILWVEASLPAESLAGVTVGAPVEVSGCKERGRVAAIGAAADFASQTVAVRATLNKPCEALRPGQIVQVRLFAPGAQDVLAIPEEAVVRSGDRPWVFVRDGEGYRALPIELAASAGGTAFVRAGLPRDAHVVVTDIAKLKAAWAGLGAPQ
jgi:cobalt-zinc-cadmium efflux system membrane fusion protein